jgi:hypothetical protein
VPEPVGEAEGRPEGAGYSPYKQGQWWGEWQTEATLIFVVVLVGMGREVSRL